MVRLPGFGYLDPAPVPDVAHEPFALEAGQFAFAAERDDDLVRIDRFLQPTEILVVIGFAELPRAVQAKPLCSLQIGAGMFGPRSGLGHASSDRHSEQEGEKSFHGDALTRTTVSEW